MLRHTADESATRMVPAGTRLCPFFFRATVAGSFIDLPCWRLGLGIAQPYNKKTLRAAISLDDRHQAASDRLGVSD